MTRLIETQPAIKKDSFIASAQRVIEIEADAVAHLATVIDEHFSKACQLILQCKGRVIVCGMGKSGIIGKKIAATLASTGTPAFFVHPGEASHGDLGMIQTQDVVIAISHSGRTAELTLLLPFIKRIGAGLIGMSGYPNSELAQLSDVHLLVPVAQEACPLGLAPTSSTTATMVMGDALAIALLEKRGFTAEDFAFSHPGGSLGKKLLVKVGDVMHAMDQFPVVKESTPIIEALLVMTEKGLGLTAVLNDKNILVGIFTDGDLRRAINKQMSLQLPVSQAMSINPKTIHATRLASEAAHLMQEHRINGVVVLNEHNAPIGALTMQDLLRAGVV